MVAMVKADRQADCDGIKPGTGGERLGDVGGRIVAEVLLGLVDGDSTSYRAAQTEWLPTLAGAQDGHFTMADLLRFAHVV